MSSAATIQKIGIALRRSVEAHAGGEPADIAIAKVASSMELNPEMACRVVEGFNAAKTRAFVKSAEDKTASFPLADKKEVLRLAFTPGEMDKVAQVEEDPDEGEFFFRERFSQTVVEKVASAPASPYGTGRHPETLAVRASSLMDLTKRDVEELRMKAAGYEGEIYDGVEKIASKFANIYDKPRFDEFEDEVYFTFGKQASPVLHIVANMIGDVPRSNLKCFERGVMFDRLDYQNEVDIVGSILGARDKRASTLEEMKEVEGEMAAHEAIFTNFMRKVAVQQPEEGDGKDKKKDPLKGILSRSFPIKRLAGKPSSDNNLIDDPLNIRKNLEDSIFGAPSSTIPEMDPINREVFNMKRQAILADIMRNDEILSNQPPEKIEDAYNTLLALSPESVMIPNVVRSFLRSQTAAEGGLDPFSAKQLSEMNTSVRGESEMYRNNQPRSRPEESGKPGKPPIRK